MAESYETSTFLELLYIYRIHHKPL